MHRFQIPILVAAAIVISPVPCAGQGVAVVEQSGEGLDADIVQDGTLDQSVAVQQIGSANSIDVVQDASLARAELSIAGVGLAATLQQSGDAEASFALTMGGSDSAIDAIQSGDAGGSNFATVWQWGYGNSVSLLQQATPGMPNYLGLTQDGVANVAVLAQTGEGNSLDLVQQGDANSAAISQIGSGLALQLLQTGGATVGIIQMGPN